MNLALSIPLSVLLRGHALPAARRRSCPRRPIPEIARLVARRVAGAARDDDPHAGRIRHPPFALRHRRSEARHRRRAPLDQGHARPLRRRVRRPAQGRVRRIRAGALAPRAEARAAGQRRRHARRRRPAGQGAHAGGVRPLRFDVRQRDECRVRRAGRQRRRVGHRGRDGARLRVREEPLSRHAGVHGGRRRGAGTARAPRTGRETRTIAA